MNINKNSTIKNQILTYIKQKALIIDGAMGTMLQNADIKQKSWIYKNKNCEGCNELLNLTAPKIVQDIHDLYIKAGANLIKTNTFGAMSWVLDDYDMADKAYDIAYAGAKIAKDLCLKYDRKNDKKYLLGSIGPGTKLPSLGHISYDEMYKGYKTVAQGLKDGGVDIFLLETCQDPLQIKAAIHALNDTDPNIPVMVSVTIELSGSMLIGTDTKTIATILEPFDILSLGFNCGTGPYEIKQHIKDLALWSSLPISIHANAGLPENIGGVSVYPMDKNEFANIQKEFLQYDGVAFLGGCCGTTPSHIEVLAKAIKDTKPKPAKIVDTNMVASLFMTKELKPANSYLKIGERSNATGSKAFKDILKNEDFDGTLTIAQQQTRDKADVLDVSVGFAGRDETKDMEKIISLYNQKIPLPLMPDSTQLSALEVSLKLIGGKPILNSVNFEDGEERFDKISILAKRFGCALVCLTIDEISMAKTTKRKLEIATRIYERATKLHGIDPKNLIFDMLVFTIGSGEEEYFTAGIETIDAIKQFVAKYPLASTTLGLSNISFGLDKDARVYLNSVYLHHCIEAGLSSAIVNVKHILPYNSIGKKEKELCENLIFNRRSQTDPLFDFISYFDKAEKIEQKTTDELSSLSDKERVIYLLKEGDKQRLIPLVLKLKDKVSAQTIVNEWLIDGMKQIGVLFGSGEMQLPFVLQSAQCMKECVDQLNPYLPKKTIEAKTKLILGTVKGDVHDVGKNLVHIILSNNGFEIENIGIKVHIDEFIKTYKQSKADAIGMSGLLVKSTNEMKTNLMELAKQNIKVPVLLGGAALTKDFVDNFCRPIYDGAIFYCRDAFDGVVAMQRIEKGGKLDVWLDSDKKATVTKPKKPKKEFDPATCKPILLQNKHNYTPPFWGVKDFHKTLNKELAFSWIDKRVLYRQRWAYKRGKKDTKEFLEYEKEVLDPLFENYKKEFINKNLFAPVAIYGYFRCKSEDDKLNIYDENLKKIATLNFPRQGISPHRSVADYFKSDSFDVVGFTIASTGLNITDYERAIYETGEFNRYYQVHGLGVELAEAVAEILHKQIRIELKITTKEKNLLSDVKMKGYQGCRYSPGYMACPDLSLNQTIFDLLKPQRYGISLSQTYQMHPEQTTCAIITPNVQAKYFSI
ncbi:MAG: methionine synthase [Campylobacteraceae bacterium 4484_166]|nr:MAG: methionine synthase [Campylobacteraceae bacterium 4484_166]